jgi:hypothetical protein
MKSSAGGKELLVHRLHALAVERAGVFDHLLADAAELRILRGVVLVGCLALQDAARAEPLAEGGILRVLGCFWLFLGIEVVQVAKELVEAVDGRQVLVAVSRGGSCRTGPWRSRSS